MGIVMVAMLAFGGTFAYFTATSADKNTTVTLGYVSLTTDAATSLNITKTIAVPGDELLKDATVTLSNKSTVATYIFVSFSTTGDIPASAITSTIVGAEGTTLTPVENETNVYYIDAAANKDYKGIVNVALSTELSENNHNGQATTEMHYMGKTITVKFDARSIQKEGLDVKTAWGLVKSQAAEHSYKPVIGG